MRALRFHLRLVSLVKPGTERFLLRILRNKSFQTIKWLLSTSYHCNKNLMFACENEQVICLISSLTPARQTLMLCLWSEGSCSSLSQATFGGSGTGIWRAVTQRCRPVTGGGFPTSSTPPLKTSQEIFGSFKVGSMVWASVMWFKVACEHRIIMHITFRQVWTGVKC